LRTAFLVWLVSLVFGVVMVLLVSDDALGPQRVFSLSDGHGPSTVDALGLLPVTVTTLYWAWCLWCSRAGLNRLELVFTGFWIVGGLTAILSAAYDTNILLLTGLIVGTAGPVGLGLSSVIGSSRGEPGRGQAHRSG
jgi:hypothetical protein